MEHTGTVVHTTPIPVVVSLPQHQPAAEHSGADVPTKSGAGPNGPRQKRPYNNNKGPYNGRGGYRRFGNTNPELNAQYREEINLAYRRIHAINTYVNTTLVKNGSKDEQLLAKLKHIYEAHIAAMIYHARNRDEIVKSFQHEMQVAAAFDIEVNLDADQFPKIKMDEFPGLNFPKGQGRYNNNRARKGSNAQHQDEHDNATVLKEIQNGGDASTDVNEHGNTEESVKPAGEQHIEASDASKGEEPKSSPEANKRNNSVRRNASRGRGQYRKNRKSISNGSGQATNVQQGDSTTDEKAQSTTNAPEQHAASGDQATKPKKARKPYVKRNKSVSGDKQEADKVKSVVAEAKQTHTEEAVSATEHQTHAQPQVEVVDKTEEKPVAAPAVEETAPVAQPVQTDGASDVKEDASKPSPDKTEQKDGSKKGFKNTRAYANKRRGKSISSADAIEGAPKKSTSEVGSPAKVVTPAAAS